jgi:hypothetical protein
MVGAGQEKTSSTHLEMIKMLLEDFRYRHENYWKLYVRFSTAVLALAVIPFLYQKDNDFLRQIYWIFPLFSILVALPAAIILHGEYSRIAAAGRNVRQLREELGYPMADLEGGFLAKLRIGNIANIIFVVFSLAAAVLSYYVFHYVVLSYE